MRTGRPRTPIGTHGAINDRAAASGVIAETRVRDARRAAPAGSGHQADRSRGAWSRLMERLRERPGYGHGGVAAAVELVRRSRRPLAGRPRPARPRQGHQENYRTCLRLHVRPAFEHYTLAEVTTGRVEWFLAKRRRSVAVAGQADPDHAQPAVRLRAAARRHHPQPGRGHLASFAGPRATPQALTIEQIAAIRRPPRPGEPTRASRAPSQTARSATSSRSCSARPCAPARYWRCGPATSRTLPDRHGGHVNGTVVQRKGAATSARIARRPTHPSGASPSRASPRSCSDDGSPHWAAARPHDLRQPRRWPVQPVQRATHVPRFPAGSPDSATPASACGGTDAPEQQ